MRVAYLFAVFLVIAGCTSNPPKPVIRWNTVHSPGKLVFDDTDKVFSSVFKDKNANWFSKRALENETEFRQRIAKANDGVVGREVTFFITPDNCKVEAKPDEKRYSIYPEGNILYPLWVNRTVSGNGSTVMQNAFGASVKVYRKSVSGKILSITNIKSLPGQVMRNTYNVGISVSTAGDNPADTDFRKWIAEKRVGIAIRGRIADLTKAEINSYNSKPTFSSPVDQDSYLEVLPFTVDAISLVIVGEDKVPIRLIEFIKP